MNEDHVCTKDNMDEFILPKYVGEYIINGSLHFYCTKKPKFIHRFFMKLLLGWEWKDTNAKM